MSDYSDKNKDKGNFEEKKIKDKPIDEVFVEEAAQIDAVLKEFDKESNTRHFEGIPKAIVKYMLVAFSVYALWMNVFSSLPEQIRRASFIGIIVFMAFMLYPSRKKGSERCNYIPWYDFILGIVGAGCFFYFVVNFQVIVDRAGRATPTDVVVGIIGILILFEICRRVVGIPILIVVACFIVYAFYAGFSLKRIIAHLFYTTEGVIGTPLGVCSTFIVLFILFGSFLDKTGVGRFFIEIANSIAGAATGGPAKVAVIASALQGMISGSSVANTVGSGSFTIPMMKKTGYPPEFAAAVEASASTGGQIMPPIMGAAAFLMAEMTGVAYSKIVVAAILPAFLYFTGIFLMVHFEAKKLGLKGLNKEDIPGFFKLMFSRGYLLLPLVVLVYCMMTGYTSSMSACYAIVASIIVSMFRKDTRMNFASFLEALENGAKNTIGVAIACSMAGMIVGVVSLTGLGLKLATGLLTLSGGITILALFFTMIACIILGMGVPTTANYVIMATITAPIVIKLGIPMLAAHMFVFYFGIVADITPPVALAAYAGSAIAKCNPLKAGFTATRIAITAFIIPYVFAFNPEMLLGQGNSIIQAAMITVTAFVGMLGISTGMEGFMKTRLKAWERILCIAAGLLLIKPGTLTDVIGIVVIVGMFVIQNMKVKRTQQA
ncbi:TRAP transporter permease [Lachnospiraceae bacterium NSJ-143]|nr:TRAP transporter permease [Lachnospiraceae bacterium NSJ-143]